VNCKDAQTLIHGYADGELDLVGTLAIERHMQSCPSCSGEFEDLQGLRTVLREGGLYYPAPERLRQRIRSELPPASNGPGIRSELRPSAGGLIIRPAAWRWLGAVAALAAVVLLAWGLRRAWAPAVAGDALAQEVLASHVRSLMADHLSDVVSSDKHTVKPWFDGRLDFSPPVEDLVAQGYPLVGGRLDYLDNRPVAALIYRRQRHIINLFTWPSPAASNQAPRLETRQGYNIVHWTSTGAEYWAVSDLNTSELQEFVRLVQQAVGGS
jgi:anti-sigma factor RsiW